MLACWNTALGTAGLACASAAEQNRRIRQLEDNLPEDCSVAYLHAKRAWLFYLRWLDGSAALCPFGMGHHLIIIHQGEHSCASLSIHPTEGSGKSSFKTPSIPHISLRICAPGIEGCPLFIFSRPLI